jgi:squalene cyclase
MNQSKKQSISGSGDLRISLFGSAGPTGAVTRTITYVAVVACSMSYSGTLAAQNKETAGKARLPRHITPETKNAIDAGLNYLVKTQGRDGAWRNAGGYGSYPVSMTSLAGMALMMDGNTTTQGRYAPNVDRAARYVTASAQQNGLIARGDGEGRPMYGHGFGMLMLGQLHGMTSDARRQEEIQTVLENAIDLTARAQSNLGGWIYQPFSRFDEGSVTITQVQALRSARNAGVAVPKEVIDQAMEYLVISQNSDGGIRYRAGAGGLSRAPITAAAVCCWFNAGQYTEPRALKALEYCKQTLPPGSRRGGHYYYAHMYLSQAMYLASEAEWDEYFPKMRDELLRLQNQDGSWSEDGVGQVYGTAVALMILQLPYNQLPIMQR